MKILTVSYQKTFIIGPYQNEKIGFEAEIDENIQSVPDALAQLKGMAEDFHKQANPHLYQESKPASYIGDEIGQTEKMKTWSTQSPAPQVIDYKQKENLEIAIDNATSLEQLSEIKEACGKSGLVSQYMKRLNEFVIK